MRISPGVGARDQFRLGFCATAGAVLVLAIAWVVLRSFAAILDVAAPFVVGLALALLLDPLVCYLQRRGSKRITAVGLVFGVFFVLMILSASLVIPAIANEASDLATNGPVYFGKVNTYVTDFLHHHKKLAGVAMPQNVSELSSQLSAKTSAYLQQSSGKLVDYVLGSVAFLIDTVITLIIAFYFLVDLDRLRARLLYLMPEKSRAPALRMSRDVGQVFADYLRGLLIVCLLFGVSTTVTLYILALFRHGIAQYALIIGVIAGILYAIPYLGALSTAILAFIVAYANGGLVIGIVALALIILLEQIFDNVVTPKIVGGGVGLHPVMALFALVLGAHLFGVPGMLISVPVAASIQVILFRLFPKLTTPTPAQFLRRQGIPPSKEESAKYMAGEDSPTKQKKDEEKDDDEDKDKP
jgi:predicted PurR-regulated permease PerM